MNECSNVCARCIAFKFVNRSIPVSAFVIVIIIIIIFFTVIQFQWKRIGLSPKKQREKSIECIATECRATCTRTLVFHILHCVSTPSFIYYWLSASILNISREQNRTVCYFTGTTSNQLCVCAFMWISMQFICLSFGLIVFIVFIQITSLELAWPRQPQQQAHRKAATE